MSKLVRANTRFITVKVTDYDIRHGEPRNSERCPIKNALHRSDWNAPKVPWDGKVNGRGVIAMTDPETGIRYEWYIPPGVNRWLMEYDAGKSVEPIEFQLDITKATQIAPRPTHKASENRNNRNRIVRESVKPRVPHGKIRPIVDFS